jgi:hypothetical protein
MVPRNRYRGLIGGPKNFPVKINLPQEWAIEWRRFAAMFPTYADALVFLLRKAKELRLEPDRYV